MQMEEKNDKERITSFVCFDIETTGLSPDRDKVIEIGAIKVQDGKIISRFQEFINPNMKLPRKITALTGITDDMLKDAKTEETIIKQFVDYTEDYVLIGHNIMFDYSFIKTAAGRQNLPFEKTGIDTLYLCRTLIHDTESKSLENMCRYYGITNDRAHRAYEDAKATAMLYVKLSNQFYRGDQEVFAPKSLIYKVKKSQPITNKQKIYLIDLIKYHKIDYIKSIENLTRSQASRMIDRIILEKGRIN